MTGTHGSEGASAGKPAGATRLGARLGAADEHLSVGRGFQRVRGVADVAEQLGADAGWVDACRGEGILHVGHERGRPADVGARAGRQVQGEELVLAEASGGRAVEHVLAGVRHPGEQGVRLGGQRMFPRPAGAVDPPDVAFAAGRRELVQHGQDREDRE